MRKSPKFSPEVMERAVRMVFDAKDQYAITSAALGTASCTPRNIGGRLVQTTPANPRGLAHSAITRASQPNEAWIQPQVSQNLLDHRSFQDGRNDLELSGAAVRAVLHVDVKAQLQRRLTCTQVTS
jgi:hypothetical protein